MASPRDLTGLLRWWSSDAPAELDSGRIVSSADVVAGSVAARFGQGRVGPERVLVDGKPVWRFGGSASPASLLTPDVPAITSAPYSWFFVLAPNAGYAGQVIAPGPNSTVTSSSAQLLAESTGSFRWSAFAGTSVTLPMPSNEQLIVVSHDGATGSTRLYVSGSGSIRQTLQRRSLAGQQHIGRHGSNDRPLAADVKAIGLVDHELSDAEITMLEQWRSEGSSSAATARLVLARATTRTVPRATSAKRRPVTGRVTEVTRTTARATPRRTVTASSAGRTRSTAVTSSSRSALAPSLVRTWVGARSGALRSLLAPAVTKTTASGASAGRRLTEARTSARSTAQAASEALRVVSGRIRTVARTAGAVTTERTTWARATTVTLVSGLVRHLRPSTGRDLELEVAPPSSAWSLEEPGTAWSVEEPASAWMASAPTIDAR